MLAHNMLLFYLEAERHWLFTVILALGLSEFKFKVVSLGVLVFGVCGV